MIERLMELMYEVQKHGQPPAEIIKDIAPGLFPTPSSLHTDDAPLLPDMEELSKQLSSNDCMTM